MNVRQLALLCCLACVSCSDVLVVDDGDPPSAGGPPLGGVSGEGGAATAPSGGAPTGGAPVPGLVPGCEELVLASEPFVVPGTDHLASNVQLAALDGNRVGLVYASPLIGQSGQIRSLTIDAPFDDWPPTLTDSIQNLQEALAAPPAPISARGDGTFALGFGVRGIFSFDQPGIVREFEPNWTQLFPVQGGGFDAIVFNSAASTYAIHNFENDADTSPTFVGEFVPSGCFTVRAVIDGSSTLMSTGSDSYCDAPASVNFHRRDAAGLTYLISMDLPFVPDEQSVALRDGGYWYFISGWATGQGSRAYSLGQFGLQEGQPWVNQEVYGDFSPTFVAWRDGFAYSRRSDAGLSIVATDGFNQTELPPMTFNITASANDVAMLVGGENDQSIVLAYPTFDGIQLMRADCVTPFK